MSEIQSHIDRGFIRFDGEPSRPFLRVDEVWHTGWDIPTVYVIDADGTVWMDNAHGGDLCRQPASRLLSEIESVEETNRVREILGMDARLTDYERGWNAALEAAIAEIGEGRLVETANRVRELSRFGRRFEP